MASSAGMPSSGNSRLGTSLVAKRFPNRAAAASSAEVVIRLSFGRCRTSRVGPHGRGSGGISLVLGGARALRGVDAVTAYLVFPRRKHQRGTDEEADGTEQGAGDREAGVDQVAGSRQHETGQGRGH